MNKNAKNNNYRQSTQKLFFTGSLISGVMLGLNAPGFGTHWLGLISLFPLIFTLENSMRKMLYLSGNGPYFFLEFVGSPEELPLQLEAIG